MPAKPARQIAVVDEEAKLLPTAPLVDWRDIVGLIGLTLLCLSVGAIYWQAGGIVLAVALLLIAWRA